MSYIRFAIILAILTFLFLWTFVLIPSDGSSYANLQFSQARTDISNAFVNLYDAQVIDHANVSTLAGKLNNAAQNLSIAILENSTNPRKAASDLLTSETLAQQVSNGTALASGAGVRNYRIMIYESMGLAIAIAVGTWLILAFAELVYRLLWLRTYRNYNVNLRKEGSSERRRFFQNRRSKKRMAFTSIVLLSGILILLTLQPILLPFVKVQPSSQLGLLGSNETNSGYPTSVIQNQSFLLNGYLVNDQGVIQYYSVVIKLGNESTLIDNSTSANAPVIATYFCVLSNSQTYVFPIDLSIRQTGTQERLIFELWSYQHSNSGWDFVYTGIFDQIWLNVTVS